MFLNRSTFPPPIYFILSVSWFMFYCNFLCDAYILLHKKGVNRRYLDKNYKN